MNFTTSVIQWNIRGIKNKKDELTQLMSTYKASVVALQETLMPTEYLHKIANYSVLGKDGTHNRRSHGGVALYIHTDVHYSPIFLSTTLQAVAATVQLKSRVTICNIYNSRSHQFSLTDLQHLYNQLPQPCILLGDFNAYHPLWGCSSVDARGQILESFISGSDLIVMNNGAPTHPNTLTDSAIDLSLCSPLVSEDFEWNTLPSVLDSDHFPIILTTHTSFPHPSPIRVMGKADWFAYETSEAWESLPQAIVHNEEALEDLYNRINRACDEAIPTTTPSKFFPKPFWTPDLKRSRAVRERLYQKYRRSPTLSNHIRWKQARAMHKNNVRKHKEREWSEFTSNLNDDVPISHLCAKVRKLKGIPPKTIRILTDPEDPHVSYSTPNQISEALARTFANTSANSNHSPEFIQHKTATEQNMPDFENFESEYNNIFTLSELKFALSKTKDSKPGEDGVTYKMIQNMPNHAKEYLVKMFNSFFRDSYFPQRWRKAIIIPIPKPEKNPNSPNSYRPIALTSCLCKLLERLINERFLDYLIMNRVLSPEQSGGQKSRSTTDHLIRLEDSIRTASKEPMIWHGERE